MAGVEIRPATKEDIARFSEDPNKPTIRAWCGELDGKIIGLGGFAFSHKRWYAFCDLTEEARPYKMHIMRGAIRAFQAARDTSIKFIYAQADPDERGAVTWMKRLGFEVDPRNPNLYRWRL